MRIVDLRNDSRIMRVSGTRNVSQVNRIARHHSATASGDVFAFQNHWRNVLRWITGGYHYIILRDGTVQWVYDDHVISNGVGGHNTNTIHICLVGSGNFTAAQEQSFDAIVRTIRARRPNITVANVLGHREFSGHASNQCPGINMVNVRARLSGPVAPPAGNQFTHVVQRGETLDAIARRHGVTVAQLVEWNGIRNPNLLQVGQRLVVRLGAPPVTPQPPPPPPAGNLFPVGTIVQFRGGPHHANATATAATGTNRTAGRARVTALAANARNQYHLVGSQGGAGNQNSNVHGWVKASLVQAVTAQPSSQGSFRVRVNVPLLNIRAGAGTNHRINGTITDRGIYTITEVRQGTGSAAGWGRLKSGAGWIALDLVARV